MNSQSNRAFPSVPNQVSQKQYSQHYQRHSNLNQIQVPDDYDQDGSPDHLLKEKFFESLGLPPDLSHNSIQNFQYQPYQNTDQFQISSRGNTDEIDSHLFKSCNDQVLPSNNPRLIPSQFSKMTPTPQKNSNFNNQMTSQHSYLTALNGGTSSFLPSQAHIGDNMDLQMFMDSQRNIDAPQPQRFQEQYNGHQNFYKQTQKSNKELMTITIEIGEGKQANILIRENDDPFELAYAFAAQHGINPELTELLADKIKMNMDQVIQEESMLSRLQQQQDMPRQQYQGSSTDFPRQTNQMNIYQNPFYQQVNSNGHRNSKSFLVDDKGGATLSNMSFNTERSNLNNQSNLSGLNSFSQWQQRMYNKFNMGCDEKKQTQPTINENSKRMIEQKRSGSAQKSQSSIHQRLHQQAVTKQKNQKQQDSFNLGGSSRINRSSFGHLIASQGKFSNRSTPSKNKNQPRAHSLQNRQAQVQISTNDNSSQISQRRPSQVVNYGERLYQKGLKRKEELERYIRDARHEQEKLSIEQYSFQPHINDTSRYLVRPRNEKAEDSLMNYGKQVKDKIDQMRTEVMHQELDQCKFKPTISRKSERIMNEKMFGNGECNSHNSCKPPVSKFNNLYEDANACMESECTFQPDTSDTRYYQSQNRDPNTTTVYQRLSSQNSRERQIEKSQLHSDLFDPETGQEYFKPIVGRAPRTQYRPQDGSIGHVLYQNSRSLKEKLETKKKMQEEQQKNKAQTIFTRDQTNRIIEKAKIQKFAEIFSQLDSDGDGKISANRIDIGTLQSDILEVLTPLFVEMEEMGQTLDEEEFIDALGRLYDSVTVPEKNILIQQKQKRDKSKTKYSEQTTFKPQLNANSLRIAAKKRPNADVADILLQKKNEYHQKILEKQQEKENSELIGCTFHPNILQSPGSSQMNSSRSRSYNRQAMMMLNNFNHSGGFDINNLAHNIASEVLKKQQQQCSNSNGLLNNLLRNLHGLTQDIDGHEIQFGDGNYASVHSAPIQQNPGIRQQIRMMH